MEEIERQENVNIEEEVVFNYSCKGCGRNIQLWFNGGELDYKECCGYRYELQHERIDFVVLKQSSVEEEAK